MSTVTRNGIPVDTTFTKRIAEHAVRKQENLARMAREIDFNNKVKQLQATDKGMKSVKTVKVNYAEFYHKKRGEWLVTPYETLAEIAHLEGEGYVQKKSWTAELQVAE